MTDPYEPNEILKNLTPTQREAAAHVDGPLLILAGPGSGKTRVITHRIAHLLDQGIPARSILALTFTNKAADEMKLRLERIFPRQNVWMGTFHRFCSRLLRQYGSLVGLAENFTIYDSDDSAKQLRMAVEEEKIELTHATPEAISSHISWAKNNLQKPSDFEAKPGSVVGKLVERIYPVYQKRMLTANAVDFDDLLLHAAVMLRENGELRRELDARYKYILVDEYQDTNFAQYAIVRSLSIDYPNLAVTGDPDQSIYGWRGANLNNILDFERDYPQVKVVKLEQNYRSTKAILRVADALIVHNRKRKAKRLFTENAEGTPVKLTAYPTQRDEAEHIAERILHGVRTEGRKYREFALFYRINALSRQFEQAFIERGIPYQIVKGLEFFQRKEIKDVLAYLNLLNNPAVDVPLLRIINTPTRGIGKATIDRLREHADRYSIPLLDACRESGLIESLGKKSASSVAKFTAMIDKLRTHVHDPLESLIGFVLQDSGYRASLENSENEEEQDRLANIEELLTAAREFDERHPEGNALELFLEQSSLAADTDAFEDDGDQVTLMTLHAAKGLEFPCVFITAMERGLIPHERSRHNAEQLEEERRLLFVGITRAEEELSLSYANYRMFRGQNLPTVPSDFLIELPRTEMEVFEAHARPRSFGWDDAASQEFEDVHEIPDDEAEFIQDEPQPSMTRRSDPPAGLAPLTTAAEMLKRNLTPRLSPDAFRQGMTVKHPQYGYGDVVALAGAGVKRTATVRFYDSPDEERKFRVAFADLSPVVDE